jgi:hypothetical protein
MQRRPTKKEGTMYKLEFRKPDGEWTTIQTEADLRWLSQRKARFMRECELDHDRIRILPLEPATTPQEADERFLWHLIMLAALIMVILLLGLSFG